MGVINRSLFQSALPGSLKFVTRISRPKAEASGSPKAECSSSSSSAGFTQASAASWKEDSPSTVKAKFLTGEKKPFSSTKKWFASCLEKKATVFVQKQQQRTAHESAAEAFYAKEYDAPAQKVRDADKRSTVTYEEYSPSRVSHRVSSSVPRESTIIHTVQWGETLCSIARKYDADLDDIAEFNDIFDTDKIQLNTRLVIPGVKLVQYPQWQQRASQRHHEKKPVQHSRVQGRLRNDLKTTRKPTAIMVSQRTRSKTRAGAQLTANLHLVSNVESAATPSVSRPLGMEMAAISGVLATAMGCGVLMSLIWSKIQSLTEDKGPKGLAGRELKINTDTMFGKQDLLHRTQKVLNASRSTFVVAPARPLKPPVQSEGQVLQKRMHDILNDRTIEFIESPLSSVCSTFAQQSASRQYPYPSPSRTPARAVPGGGADSRVPSLCRIGHPPVTVRSNNLVL